jgi:hypothetical protein
MYIKSFTSTSQRKIKLKLIQLTPPPAAAAASSLHPSLRASASSTSVWGFALHLYICKHLKVGDYHGGQPFEIFLAALGFALAAPPVENFTFLLPLSREPPKFAFPLLVKILVKLVDANFVALRPLTATLWSILLLNYLVYISGIAFYFL